MSAIPPERLAVWDAPPPARRWRAARWLGLLALLLTLGVVIWLAIVLLDRPSPTSVSARLEHEVALPPPEPAGTLPEATAQLQASRDELGAEVAGLRQELARLEEQLAARRAELARLDAATLERREAAEGTAATPLRPAFPFPAPRPGPGPR